jgi:hypothetical protein
LDKKTTDYISLGLMDSEHEKKNDSWWPCKWIFISAIKMTFNITILFLANSKFFHEYSIKKT